MTLRYRCLFLIFTLAVLASAPAHSKRIALVVGNDNYAQVPRLEKAGNDAEAMARELQAAGFEVKKYRDLNFKQMVLAFEAFFDQIKGGDDVLVFYAGHGVQTDRGSYLLPTDIEGETQSQIEKMSYSVNGLLEELDKIKARFSLLVVDACRDNPLRSRGRSIGIARGLNAPDLAKGQMVIFSAGKNQKALDSLSAGDLHPNGIFTREFLPHMRKPGVSVEAMALEVKNSVERLARTVNHDQRPLIVNDFSGDFYFYAPASSAAGAASRESAGPGEAAREDSFWQDSKAPDNPEGYAAYLGQYPSGRYAGLARANISRLKPALAAPPSNPPAAAPTPPLGAATPRPDQGTFAPASAPSGSQPPASAPPVAATDSTPRQASYTLANGDRYEGEVVGALRTGRGQYFFANGDRYEGELKDNSLTGKGKMSFADGSYYEGDFVGGSKHGQGTYLFPNQDRYEGPFVDNLHHGKGSITYASGDHYEGEFERGIKQGQGVYRFANGDRFVGPFVNNMFNGKGTLYFATRDRYEGEFRDSAKNGMGVHYFSNGDRYEGAFRAGVQSGLGTHFYLSGDKFVGQFQAGVRHGKGVYSFVGGGEKAMEFAKGVESTP